MKILVSLCLALFVAEAAFATCSIDTQGVLPANYNGSSFVPCNSCRSAQDFPQDFLAAANNYFFHSEAGLSAIARQVGTVSGEPARQPICNDHGQCVTASVEFLFTYYEVPIVDFPIPLPELDGHTMQVTTAGGESTSQTYSGPTAEFQIPSNATPDTIPDGECRNSNGTSREPVADTPPDTDTGGDGESGDDDDGYFEWDLSPNIRCGTTYVDGGEPRTTCWVIY